MSFWGLQELPRVASEPLGCGLEIYNTGPKAEQQNPIFGHDRGRRFLKS